MSEIGEAIAKAGLSALLLLAAGVLPPLAAGTVLQLVTGRFRRKAAEVFGARFCIWSTAPGVMLHEFSHALLCVVFRHRITDFALFSPQKNGNLGWVAHKWNPRSLWQNIGCFFIGVAPIAFGVAAIVFLTLLLLPAESLPFPPLPGSRRSAFSSAPRFSPSAGSGSSRICCCAGGAGSGSTPSSPSARRSR